MSRDHVMGLMKSLKFVAIPKAYDEVLATARKRKQTTDTVIEQLFEIEVSERQARSIRYRMTQARFPVAKDLDSFEFDKLAVEEVRSRASMPATLSKSIATLSLSAAPAPAKPIWQPPSPRRLYAPASVPSSLTSLILPINSNRKN